MPTWSRKNAYWLLGYLAAMAVLFSVLLWARARVVQSLSSLAAQAEWENWKREETARQKAADVPVRRKPPKAAEPPALILMRDNFAPIAALSLVVASLIFGFVMLVVRGGAATSPESTTRDDRPPAGSGAT